MRLVLSPDHSHLSLVYPGLWVDLLQLNKTFSRRLEEVTPENISKFASDSKAWVRRFLHENNVTPYIHALANHEFTTMRRVVLVVLCIPELQVCVHVDHCSEKDCVMFCSHTHTHTHRLTSGH